MNQMNALITAYRNNIAHTRQLLNDQELLLNTWSGVGVSQSSGGGARGVASVPTTTTANNSSRRRSSTSRNRNRSGARGAQILGVAQQPTRVRNRSR